MARIQWKSRRSLGLLASLFVLYFFIRVKNYEYGSSVSIPKVMPIEIWEFVVDFSNMKYLNPTITDFNILDDNGNYDHWKYSTEYWEKLSHWPYLPNYATAHFDVKAYPKNNTYIIHSTHRTCLFMGLYCLDSNSEFKFIEDKQNQGTYCIENVIYQCPVILSSFCRREVTYQRDAIMRNLKKKFS